MSGSNIQYAMWVVYGYAIWIFGAYAWDWCKKCFRFIRGKNAP